jgi:nucleoside 2-deoxyribosyltransferase
MVAAGQSWAVAAALIKSRDMAALRASDLVVAILPKELVGAGVAFELGAADALGVPCWSLAMDDERRARSPLVESTIARRFSTIDELSDAVLRCDWRR